MITTDCIPYFDHSKIITAKNTNYNLMQVKLNDLNDPTYGFITTINKLLLEFSTNFPEPPTDIYDLWIYNNYAYFVEQLQRIKEAYMTYTGTFVIVTNLIRFKENLVQLAINYNVYNQGYLVLLINEIFLTLSVLPLPTLAEINTAYVNITADFDINSFTMDKATFRLGVIELLVTEINAGLSVSTVDQAIDTVDPVYNELQINYMLTIFLTTAEPDTLTYDLTNFRYLFL